MITGISEEKDDWGTHLTLTTDTRRKEYLITIGKDGSLHFESSLYYRFEDFREFVDKLYGKKGALPFFSQQLIQRQINEEIK